MVKRVGIVLNSFGEGGAERAAINLANAISDRGYLIFLIAKKSDEEYSINSSIVKLEVHKTVKWTKVFALRRLIVRNKLDVLIGTSTTLNLQVTLATLGNDCKCIAWEHNNYLYRYGEVLNRFVKHYIYKLADKVVILTQRDIDVFYSKHLSNTIVIPNPSSFWLTSNYERAELLAKRTIVWIGDLGRFEHKGVDRLISILQELKKRGASYSFVIIGNDPGNFFMEEIDKNNLSSFVSVVGRINNVEEYLINSKALILTSKWEGLPMVIIEALSLGVPTISFDIFTGPSELIESGYNGYLVDDGDICKFVDRVLDLMGLSFEDYGKMVSNSLKSSSRFKINKIADEWEAVFDSVVRRKN